MGRTLIPADDQGAGNPVVMLGYSFWKNELGGRTDILNQSIRLFGQIFTIVGVAPRGFYGTTVELPPDVIMPLATATSLSKISPVLPLSPDSAYFWLYLVARIKPGVTREQVAAHYAGAYAASVEEQIQTDKALDPNNAQRLRKSRLNFVDGSRGYSTIQDKSKKTLHILMAATGMVLLILAIGLILGIPTALAVSKVVNGQLFVVGANDPLVMMGIKAAESRLFGVNAFDPMVVAGASLALGLAAFAAAYLPAWRASRVDLLNALRCE